MVRICYYHRQAKQSADARMWKMISKKSQVRLSYIIVCKGSHAISIAHSRSLSCRRRRVVDIHRSQLGFYGRNDLRIKLFFLLGFSHTVMCQQCLSVSSFKIYTHGDLVHLSHLSCPQPGHCGELFKKRLLHFSHCHRTLVLGFRHVLLNLSSCFSTSSVSLSGSASPG